jgi:hypothetical protein
LENKTAQDQEGPIPLRTPVSTNTPGNSAFSDIPSFLASLSLPLLLWFQLVADWLLRCIVAVCGSIDLGGAREIRVAGPYNRTDDSQDRGIEGSLRQGLKVLTLIGRIQAQHIAELKELFEVEADHRRIVVDLREVRLADRETVQFLAECESSGIRLENCPAYIREWMERENGEGK